MPRPSPAPSLRAPVSGPGRSWLHLAPHQRWHLQAGRQAPGTGPLRLLGQPAASAPAAAATGCCPPCRAGNEVPDSPGDSGCGGLSGCPKRVAGPRRPDAPAAPAAAGARCSWVWVHWGRAAGWPAFPPPLSHHQGMGLMQRRVGRAWTPSHTPVGAGLEAQGPLEGFLPEAFLPLGPGSPFQGPSLRVQSCAGRVAAGGHGPPGAGRSSGPAAQDWQQVGPARPVDPRPLTTRPPLSDRGAGEQAFPGVCEPRGPVCSGPPAGPGDATGRRHADLPTPPWPLCVGGLAQLPAALPRPPPVPGPGQTASAAGREKDAESPGVLVPGPRGRSPPAAPTAGRLPPRPRRHGPCLLLQGLMWLSYFGQPFK